MEIKTCTCGTTPKYYGNSTWGYIECSNCHKRSKNHVDVDCRIEFGKDNYGNVGYFKRFHNPNAEGMAWEDWNDMISNNE